MDPDNTPEPRKAKASLGVFLAPLKNVLNPFKNLLRALKNLVIPKKLIIPAIAGAALLIAGGAAFGLLHAKLKHVVPAQLKAGAAGQVASPAMPSTAPAMPSTACSGVVRDIYRQTVAEDPSVTLAEVRSEVVSSGVNCVPDPEIAAKLKDLSPACRDMVQYTFLGVRDGHADITVNDVREKVVEKSVACEHDRVPNIASVARHRAK